MGVLLLGAIDCGSCLFLFNNVILWYHLDLADSTTELHEEPGFIAGVTIGSILIVILLLLAVLVFCYWWFRRGGSKYSVTQTSKYKVYKYNFTVSSQTYM